jgi:hypothetical protein
MRIVALAETGTRGLLGAVIGGKGERSEVPLARNLVPLLRQGMLLLADRAYDAAGAAEGGRRDRGARPGPRQRRPQAPGPGGLARRVLPVPDRRPLGTDHRGRPGRARRRRDPARGRLTRLMTGQPGRDWAGRDLADLPGIKPRNMLAGTACCHDPFMLRR